MMSEKRKLKILECAKKKLCEAMDQTEKLCYQETASRSVQSRISATISTIEFIQAAIQTRIDRR